MKVWKYFVLTGAIAVLSACVATAPKLNVYDTQAVANAVSATRDDFQKTVDYSGPNIATGFGGILIIRAWKFEKTNEIKYQIYVADYYDGEWRFYDNAYDSNGERLDTTLISRKVEDCSRYGCSHTEHVGLNITKEYLEKNKDSGINFKLSGKAGQAIFFIPGSYVQAILAAVNGTPIAQTSSATITASDINQKTAGSGRVRLVGIGGKMKSVCSLDELKEYYKKTACNTDDLTLAQLTDKSKITPKQKPVILRQQEIMNPIRDEFFEVSESMGGNEARQGRIARELNPDSQSNYLDLYSEKITWGEFNQKRKDITKQIVDRIRSGR